MVTPRAPQVTRRWRRPALVAVVVIGLLAAGAVPSQAADPPPPGPIVSGSGNLEGTELVEEQNLTGALCFATTKHIFGLRGAGDFYGRTPSGQNVVFRTSLASGQTLYGDGLFRLEVENTQPYFHSPFGTHGSDASCSAATAGDPVAATFRLFAADHVYKLDGANQVPCTGQGTYARGDKTHETTSAHWYAQWTLDSACTVVGNAEGTPGTGVARVGTAITHSGDHDPCFGEFGCPKNIRVNYRQYLPVEGLYVAVGGSASAQIGSPVTLVAVVKFDGQAVPNAPVTFSVAGPAPSAPPGSAAVTGADGQATFTLTAGAAGDYTVTATATYAGGPAGSLPTSKSGSHVVKFRDLAPPAVTLAGPAQAQTEEDVMVTATLTYLGNPAPGTQVNFSVVGAGQATPSSGSATTDQNGRAAFTFRGDRAGSYTVSASATVAGQSASAAHPLSLVIRTLWRESALTLATNEQSLQDAVVDPTGRFAYFLGNSRVIKVELPTMQRVGDLTIVGAHSVVMAPDGRFAYVGTEFGQVTRVDLATFQLAGTLTLDIGSRRLQTAVIDPAGAYAYFGWVGSTRGIVKVDLSTFTQAGKFPVVKGPLSTAVDPAGNFAYLGLGGEGDSGEILKVDLASFQPAGTVTLAGVDEISPQSAVIDPSGQFAYFAVASTGVSVPERVVKVDLATFTRVGYIALGDAGGGAGEAVMDPAGRYAYFSRSQSQSPVIVARVDLSTFTVMSDIRLAADETSDGAAVIAPDGGFAYFGAWKPSTTTGGIDQQPGHVVKVGLTRPPVAWLSAGNDSFTTPFATPLSVPAPGVLANDSDTQDSDPLGATLVRDPAHGTVTLSRDGSFTYTPAQGFSGADTFTYKVDDGMNFSAPATVTITIPAPPQGVQAVSGSAFGFSTNVSLFGGPETVKGGLGSTCGQAGQPACADGQSPAVNLAPGGGSLSATDPDGNLGQYGPARIFENHGPITAEAQGTTGPTGAVTASAVVRNVEDNDPFHAHAPNGEAKSSCAASQSVLSGATRITNGRLVVHTNPSSGEATEEVTFPPVWDPAPNTTYNGALDHVGDRWRMVFNEQILTPEAITVNAVHMYLLGPAAVGDMIIGSSRCGVVTAAANAAPVGNDDAYNATAGRPLVVPAAGVLANDTDADGQPLSAAKPAGIPPPASGGGNWTFPGEPAHGDLDLRSDGSFTYTPARGYSGPDSFTYLARDSRGKSDPATVSITVAPATRKATADFDGNGATDVSVFRPATGTWYLQGSAQQNYGVSGDIAVPADYDGDGKTDVAVFRPSNGVWYLHGSAGTDSAVAFGANGDVPVPADYDGDGKADRAVFRSGVWYVKGSAGVDSAVAFGAAGDVAVPADYDGDGKADRAVFRSGVWYVKGSAGTDTATAFGTTGDVPVPGDYDGNGTAELAVFRPSNGVWFVQGGATTAWGTNGDVPVPGDYDGDGDLELAVFRPSNGVWFVQGGATTAWGASGDVPLPLPAAAYRAMG